MPALPLDEAGKYVAAAYVVFVLLLVVYIAIMAAKLGRISRELEELADLAEQPGAREREVARAPSPSVEDAPVAAAGGERS